METAIQNLAHELPTMQLSHWVTSVAAFLEITSSFTWNRKQLYATSPSCGVELPKTCQHNIICKIWWSCPLIWQCRVFTWKQNNISLWFKTLCIFLHINKTIWTLKTGQKHRSDGIWCNRTEENIILSYFSFLINLPIWNGPLHSTLSHNIIQVH